MSLPAAVTQDTRQIRPCQTFEGHTEGVNRVIHLPGGQRIMTCSNDGSLRVWDLQTGKQISNWRDGAKVRTIALSPDEKKVVSGNVDGVVRLWNLDTGKVTAKWTEHMGSIRSVCWNRDYERVMSGCLDGTARVWDVESGKTVLEIESGLSEVWEAIYSPDTTMIAIGGDSEEKEFISIWDANTGKLVTKLKGHTQRVNCLAWTPDGTALISGSFDYSVRTWNTTTWQQIAVLTDHYDGVAIAISSNGRILASASWVGEVQLWDFQNGQPINIGSPLQGAYYDGRHVMHSMSFSTDGKLLAAACWDKNSYTWDISAIVRTAGLDELLLNPNDSGKSPLNADATRRPGQRREDARPLHPGFFDDSPRHPDPSRIRRLPTSSTRHVTPSQPRFLNWTRNPSFNWPRRRKDEHIELQEHRPTVVDVPLAKSKPRNYTARELRLRKEKEKARDTKKAQNAKNTSTSSSRPPQSNATQQSTGVPRAKSSELHADVSISSTSAAVPEATTPATSLPNAIIPRAGRWTRFWLFICCASAQYTDGHH